MVVSRSLSSSVRLTVTGAFRKESSNPGSRSSSAQGRVEEETGLLCNIGAYLGQTEYIDRRDRPKIVHYWLMEPLEGEFEPTEEVADMQWVSIELARMVLTYEHDRELLERNVVPALAARLFAARA